MSPALQIGDIIAVNHLAYGFRNPFRKNRSIPVKKGDIIVFKSPTGDRWVKRVSALAGEMVSGRKIPECHCYVRGDNSSNSLDSRVIGPIPLSKVYGKAFRVLGNVKNEKREAFSIPASGLL